MLKNIRCWSNWWIKDIVKDFVMWIGAPIKLRCYYRPKWRKLNSHNFTEIKKSISESNMKKIKIWNYTFWDIDVRLWWYSDIYIQIWSYCSIGPEVQFICWMDHSVKQISTYIFWVNLPYIKGDSNKWREMWCLENNNKWPIIVDDDVRIWTWAKIMSWVHIWQWAVIAAWAVVTKDIPPYAIAWGVPAKVIKYRFSENKIKKLLQIDYANTPIENFLWIYSEIIKEDFDIDYILRKLKSQ